MNHRAHRVNKKKIIPPPVCSVIKLPSVPPVVKKYPPVVKKYPSVVKKYPSVPSVVDTINTNVYPYVYQEVYL